MSSFEREPQKLIISCRTIIKDNTGRFLLVQRGPTDRYKPFSWEIPGGKMDQGENNKVQTAKREAMEEIGADIKITKRLSSTSHVISDGIIPEYQGALFLCFYFEAKLDPFYQEIKLSEDHINYKWVTLDEAKKLDLAQTSLDYFEKLAIEH